MKMKKKRRLPKMVVVLVTCPTQAVGRRLAERLVKSHLAACVNLIPQVESIFQWQGKIDRCREALLVVKTTAERFERLRRTVVQFHPYKVPEVIALPIAAGHPPYLRWLSASLLSSR